MKTAKNMTVGTWILDKVNTPKWRAGELSGCKHYTHGTGKSERAADALYEMMNAVGGRAPFWKQIQELEKAGLIQVKYKNVNTEVEKITISIEQIDRLCEYEGVENLRKTVLEKKEYLKEQQKLTNCEWLRTYEEVLLQQLERGIIDTNLRDEKIFLLLNALVNLEQEVWEHKFSSDVLEDSKMFENCYKDKIITILRKYSPQVEESMNNDEVLAEHNIWKYSQSLQWKGGLLYEVGAGVIDSSRQIYGSVMNAQALVHAKLLSLQGIKEVITIENQANYESVSYDEEKLYLFTHGFLSPKERRFLAQIEKMAGDEVTFYHWSDLDYGGIRIYKFMKEHVFPRVQPLYMNRKVYEYLLNKGKGLALSPEKRKSLEQLQCAELEELKQCILEHGVEFEQETLIGGFE